MIPWHQATLGMVQANLIQLAQQGDPAAIARLLNQSLQPRGVTAKVLLRDQRLKILLSSERPLDQKAFVQLVQQQIESWAIESIVAVKVYSQQSADGVPAWTQDFVPAVSKAQLRSPAKPQTAIVPFQGSTAIGKIKTESQDFWATLRTFQFASVFPYRDVFSAELYHSPTVRLLLFLGLFPLIINLIAEQASLRQTAWLLGIYYASIWGVMLYNLIKPVQVSWGNTLRCVVFTAIVGIPLLLIFQKVPPFNMLYDAINQGLLFRMAGFILGVGVLEELCKALPVYLLLVHPKLLLTQPQRLPDPLSAAFYGAMSGLGFAIAEGAAYSFFYASGLSKGQLGLGSYVAANTIRFVSLPLFHAILAGIVGHFIGLAVINPSRRSAICFIGVAIAATLHGLYNSFADGIPGFIIVGFTILLFVTYLRRSQQLVNEMHQAERKARKTRLE
jgi:RsiW-degrading membrane proteinase PrsW (M82 family)